MKEIACMKRRHVPFLWLFTLSIMVFLTPSLAAQAFGEEKKRDLPPRAISIAPEYTGIVVPKGEGVSIDLNVTNGGREDESIEVTIPTVPQGWSAKIKTYSFGVTGVHVASDKSKNLTLKLDPQEGVAPGKYVFPITAQTVDGKLNASSRLTVTVTEAGKEKEDKGVVITTSYPVLKGPTDAKFEFSLEVENKTDKEAIFNLNAQGPENWEINFKPTYEEKYFSSLRIKAGSSQSVAVSVKPYPLAEPGNYPIKVRVSSEQAKSEAELQVVLTGSYKIDMGTPSGLLSLNAVRGKQANISFYVKNTGSAPQNNVRFVSFKPENWKVEFKPEKLDTLPPGELQQVELTVTPSDQALVGDYSVAISVEGEKANKNMEFRVTVKASTAWGWVGIGIIVIVLAGLVGLFMSFGRR
ncbi:MAG: hypothetical protein C4576_09300 [Desulfobacteraceae bacterium]|nr:MAG: hypothetical protein C4576_09300 [Desulfobacteraceae bacterium]